MVWRIVIFLFIFSLAPVSHAEYYLVYGRASAVEVCPSVKKHRTHKKHVYKHKKKKHHYVRHRKPSPVIEVYYPCYQEVCNPCSCPTYYRPCNGRAVVYTSRPSSCTTYQDVVTGW